MTHCHPTCWRCGRMNCTAFPRRAQTIEKRKRMAAYLDAGHGSCWLRRSEIAGIVEEALQFFDGERYRLIAWVIMPNHVHVIIEMKPGHSLGGILHSWKSFSARQANKQLGRSGAFWHREYYDRFIRDAAHLRSAVRYVEFNPVNAGMCRSPEEWPFGSARWMAESLKADSAKPARMPAVPGDTSEECHLGAPASSTGSDEFDSARRIQRPAAKDGGGPG